MTNDPRATDPDDFWGNQADWPEVPEEERKAPRTSTGSKVSRWWNQVIGGGVEGTRQHSGRGAASRDHGDFAQDEFDPAPDDPIAAPVPARRAAEPSIPTEAVDESWDDEWIVEPDPTPSPGVDPLLARLGGLAIVTTLLIPLALGLRSHDDSPAAADVTSRGRHARRAGGHERPANPHGHGSTDGRGRHRGVNVCRIVGRRDRGARTGDHGRARRVDAADQRRRPEHQRR